jgi:hypothetical protein
VLERQNGCLNARAKILAVHYWCLVLKCQSHAPVSSVLTLKMQYFPNQPIFMMGINEIDMK